GLDAVIFWGSQSGRAEIFAKRLSDSLEVRFGLKVLVADLSDYDHSSLSELDIHHVCAFVLSTYGDGDPPDNTEGFWRTIHQLLESGSHLPNMRYLIFGLGNSKYRQFNHVAETVDRVLQQLRANRIGDVGRGDDANGTTEDDFLSWRKKVEEHLKAEFGLQEQAGSYKPAYIVQELNQVHPHAVFKGEPHRALLRKDPHMRKLVDQNMPRVLTVIQAKILWESLDRLCLHIELDLGTDRLLKYKTGDHLAFWPSNPVREVNQLITILGLQDSRKSVISINPVNGSVHARESLFSPTTIEALFTHYLEICGPISRETVQALSHFAPSEKIKMRLLHMSDDADRFKQQVVKKHMTLPDLMKTVGEDLIWNVPLSFFLEKLKAMQPRYYSISSSAVVQPQQVSITVVVDKPPADISGDFKTASVGGWGLATSYLNALQRSYTRNVSEEPSSPFELNGAHGLLAEHKIFGCVKRSDFKLPVRASTPIIMVGCGTGVAPYRAFIQERARRKQMGQQIGTTLLFMGYRSIASGFLYKEEWLKYQQIIGKDVFKIWTALSQEPGESKVYVQNRLAENAVEILNLFEEDAACRIYICGSADMARDVISVLSQMRRQVSNEDEKTSSAWIRQLRQSKRLLEDVWH
ncbi:MAG: hypothetical protein FE78DRAFT_154402, partial [Acidomyces sp. 'richmondensis']